MRMFAGGTLLASGAASAGGNPVRQSGKERKMRIARTVISPLLLIGAMLAPFPATAQQFQGEPGAPATQEFPDLRVLPVPTPPFVGDIQPNLIDSKPGWPSTIAPPEGAPNVLLVLIDDAGFASNSAFGGVVPTPTVDKLAQRGLRYTQMHNTALCSPTRAGPAHGAQSPRRRLRHGGRRG